MHKYSEDRNFLKSLRNLFIGKARNLYDEQIFRHVTLIAFFAWIGLGSDGLSSSCYGPEEAYRALGHYHNLTIFVAIGIVLTIFIISSSYSQIIKLFPSGGGGYKVATKLLSPKLGMISGSALLVDYVLTITISVASGSDALFSMLPPAWQPMKILITMFGILVLLVLNLRGIKESVFSLMPVFILFVVVHIFLIFYSIFSNVGTIPVVYDRSLHEFSEASRNLGLFGVLALLLKSYSMGAGTYTGIEAVSNSLPILKEPRVKTGLITMRYMAVSLAMTVLGLMFAYAIFEVNPSPVKTLNAVLLDHFTASWNSHLGWIFRVAVLFSEAAILFIAAQTGFLDGPRVIASMAGDNWFPRRFAVLSDRLVTQNGILFMGIMAMIMLVITGGSVKILIVLYSINVFITFALSQAGMVRHWYQERHAEKRWAGKLLINGVGLCLTLFVLTTVVTMKFREGGWVTLIITTLLILLVSRIRKHYTFAQKHIQRMDAKMIHCVDERLKQKAEGITMPVHYDPDSKTAAVCVSGYNGLGIKTFLRIVEDFKEFRNFVFIEVGIIDAGNFKGKDELGNLELQVQENLEKYRKLAEVYGFYAECYQSIGTDVADEIKEISKLVIAKYSNTIFFVGQFIIPRSTALQRMLHNQTQLAIQNRLAHKGYILVMVPIRSYNHLQ